MSLTETFHAYSPMFIAHTSRSTPLGQTLPGTSGYRTGWRPRLLKNCTSSCRVSSMHPLLPLWPKTSRLGSNNTPLHLLCILQPALWGTVGWSFHHLVWRTHGYPAVQALPMAIHYERLPTAALLHHRCIIDTHICALCGHYEDQYHLFLHQGSFSLAPHWLAVCALPQFLSGALESFQCYLTALRLQHDRPSLQPYFRTSGEAGWGGFLHLPRCTQHHHHRNRERPWTLGTPVQSVEWEFLLFWRATPRASLKITS
jgi:hypothetical protein